MSISSGTLTSAFALDIQSAFDWQNAVVAGGGALNTSGTTTYSNNATLSGKTWNNYGLASNAGSYLNMNSSTVNNQSGGVLTLTGTSSFRGASGTNSVANLAGGTIHKNGAGTNPVDDFGNPFTFSNAGTINVNAGTLLLNRGGTDTGTYNISAGATLDSTTNRDFNSGISFTGTGSLLFSGTSQTFGAAHTFAAAGPIVYVVNGGTLTSSSDLNFLGTLDWSGGTINGAGALNTSGATTIGVFCCNLNGKTWNNYGVATMGSHLFLNSATVNNKSGGVMNWNGASAFRGNSGTNTVTNEAGGVINKAAAGTLTLDDFANPFTFNNNGTVNVTADALTLNRPFTQGATGIYNIAQVRRYPPARRASPITAQSTVAGPWISEARR